MFDADLTSDQKRIARGEHYRYARTLLRERDRIHNRRWRVLTIAGRNAGEEIACIRALMPKSYIVAVDIDTQAVAAARDAGADEAFACDVLELSRLPRKTYAYRPASLLARSEKFDVICFDFCAGASPELKKAAGTYNRHLLTGRGVFILNFSYGRDVVEAFAADARDLAGSHPACLLNSIDPPMIGRIAAAIPGTWRSNAQLRSVLLYRGNAMPMCSCLWIKTRSIAPDRGWLGPPPELTRLDDADHPLLVLDGYDDDPSLVYATPRDRIAALRRSRAAQRAARTRAAKAAG